MTDQAMTDLRAQILELQNRLAEWSHNWIKQRPGTIMMGDEPIPDLANATWECSKCGERAATHARGAGFHAPTPASAGHDTRCQPKSKASQGECAHTLRKAGDAWQCSTCNAVFTPAVAT